MRDVNATRQIDREFRLRRDIVRVAWKVAGLRLDVSRRGRKVHDGCSCHCLRTGATMAWSVGWLCHVPLAYTRLVKRIASYDYSNLSSFCTRTLHLFSRIGLALSLLF